MDTTKYRKQLELSSDRLNQIETCFRLKLQYELCYGARIMSREYHLFEDQILILKIVNSLNVLPKSTRNQQDHLFKGGL